MGAQVGALIEPSIQLILEVDLVGEAPTRLEAGLHVALQALDDPLGLGVGRLAEVPTDPKQSAEGRKRLGGPCRPGVQGPLAIPHERAGQAPQAPQAAGDPPQQVRGRLGEHQGAGAGARVAQAGDNDPAAAFLAMADRDRPARLPEVELADLARAVGGALEGPGGRKQRAHLAQVVIEDRPPALIAGLLDQLAHAGAGHLRLGRQQPVDLLLVGVQLGGHRLALIARRLLGAQGLSDRHPAEADAPVDLLDRQALDGVHTADLGPLLHLDHDPLLAVKSQDVV